LNNRANNHGDSFEKLQPSQEVNYKKLEKKIKLEVSPPRQEATTT